MKKVLVINLKSIVVFALEKSIDLKLEGNKCFAEQNNKLKKLSSLVRNTSRDSLFSMSRLPGN